MKTLIYQKSTGLILSWFDEIPESDLGIIEKPEGEYRDPMRVENGEIIYHPNLSERAKVQILTEIIESGVVDDKAIEQMPELWQDVLVDTAVNSVTLEARREERRQPEPEILPEPEPEPEPKEEGRQARV